MRDEEPAEPEADGGGYQVASHPRGSPLLGSPGLEDQERQGGQRRGLDEPGGDHEENREDRPTAMGGVHPAEQGDKHQRLEMGGGEGGGEQQGIHPEQHERLGSG